MMKISKKIADEMFFSLIKIFNKLNQRDTHYVNIGNIGDGSLLMIMAFDNGRWRYSAHEMEYAQYDLHGKEAGKNKNHGT